MAIRVLLADDHALVREGIRELLEDRTEFDVVGEAASGHEAVQAALEARPDIVILDLHMPSGDGLWATAEITRELPGTRILILTVSTEDEHLRESLRQGATGYVLKSSPADTLFQAIREVARGETTLPGAMASRMLAHLDLYGHRDAAGTDAGLSGREVDVLRLLARGGTNRHIAESLEISENTVKAHIKGILRKLGVANRVEAAGWALRNLEGLRDAPLDRPARSS